MIKNMDETFKNRIWRIVTSLYATILFLIHFIRIFDRNFWGDEAFTINLVSTSFSNMIQITAADVHPPFYYIIVRLFADLFGYSGFIYHLVSLLPFGMILILSLTIIWKWFGKESSILLITFSSLLTESIKMNVEVRMYTWASLFVLIAYLSLYEILSTNRKRGWMIFVIASLAAAYTHYYCLISVAFFYIVLILVSIFRKNLMLKSMILACSFTVLAYIPWLFIIFSTFQSSIDNFWQTGVMELWPCFEYLFLSKFSLILFILFVISLILWFIKELGLKQFFRKEINKIVISEKSIWVFAGILSIIGTIFVGIMLSIFVRPMFIPRYLFPISVAAWIVFGICISNIKGKNIVLALIVFLVLYSGIPEYYETYTLEKQSNVQLEKTLELTVPNIEKDDIIITDTIHIIWTISDLYYPDVPCESIHSLLELLDKDITFWCILSEGLNEELETELNNKGFKIETVITDGVLGTHPVSVYRIYSL